MADRRSCPHCGGSVREGSARDVCPACLLSVALEPTDAEDALPWSPSVPEVIGPYRLIGLLGTGGMGEVYLAEQTQPPQRRVALKIIKRGIDIEPAIARFGSERQVLLLLNHPHIARVLGAGDVEGRPYFVTEYVPGIPITEYCDRLRLTTGCRLVLFTQVCHAVQHAHQKGIVHRDLKPSNVLVARQDGQPVPKVIDFGVAKAIDQRLTDTTTDIYSLGVLLHKLIVGASLGRQLRDDLEWITRKALEKDTTRYTTASELADDIERHLAATTPYSFFMLIRKVCS